MGQFILITGVSSGIGHGLVQHYIAKGFIVIGTVRNKIDGHDLEHANFHKVVYDVVDKSGIGAFKSEIQSILGTSTLFALINNAGIAKAGPLECVKDEDFEMQMEVNVNAVRRITNAMLGFMKEGSRIINISSVSGLFNSPFMGPYCISKHALESMSDIYRRELKIFGIKVVAIEPGPIKTKIWGKARGTFEPFMSTRYASFAPKADTMIDSAEKYALDVSHVIKACDKALFDDKPGARYLVHKSKVMFKLITTFAPDRMVDWLVARNLKKGEKHRAI